MNIPQTITEIFQQKFGHAPARIVRAPGRVNLLSEHVDYNDGLVMPVAIDRATYIAFSPKDAPQTALVATDFAEESFFTLTNLSAKLQPDNSPLPEWAKYPAGVAWSLTEKNLPVKNMQAVFASDVPRGAGLSSSASVELAFAVAWMTLGGWKLSPMELALICQRAENKYVGVNCGIMDQFASACGVKNKLLLLDCRSLEYQTLPLPKDVAIVIADTSMRRELTTSEYNNRRADCEEAVRIIQKDLPDVKALRDVSVENFNRLAQKLPAQVEKHARHVVEEIERTNRAVKILHDGDIVRFGKLMNECHASLRDYFEVSIPELDTMARIAQSLPGCYGARLTGAGFGGCVAALVARDHVEAFAKKLADDYESETRRHPEIYICEASDGAGEISKVF